jgi:hypothetical protein
MLQVEVTSESHVQIKSYAKKSPIFTLKSLASALLGAGGGGAALLVELSPLGAIHVPTTQGSQSVKIPDGRYLLLATVPE